MEIWQFIEEKLNQNLKLYLMCVMQHQGSSPGRQGFKMAVASDEAIHGSIGGGVMEFNLVELCKKMLASDDLKPMVKHQVHKGNIVDGSGMICSGEQTVIFYPLQIAQQPTINQIINTLKQGNSGLLDFSPKEFSFQDQDSALQFNFSHQDEANWNYQELLNYKDQVYIVGGGHVGLATSKLLRDLGFYVVVFDNRENLNTFEANTSAHQKHLIDYKEAAHYIPKKDVFIAIMTNKYTDDKLVPEGIVGRVNYKGELFESIHQFIGGLRAGMGYCGAKDINTLKETGQFVKITASGINESHPHDVTITKESPNYSR